MIAGELVSLGAGARLESGLLRGQIETFAAFCGRNEPVLDFRSNLRCWGQQITAGAVAVDGPH